MKKLISFALVLTLIFSLAACGKSNSNVEVVKEYESQPLNDDYQGEQKVALSPNSVNNFCNGYAWIKRSDTSDNTIYSLIDTSGKVIYSSSGDIYTHDMSNNACFIKESIGDDKYVYKIINKEGKVTATSQDGKFDAIYASGDNLFFVYKYEGSIDASRHLYGTVNENGEFVNKLRECPYGQLSESFTKYVGAKTFLVGVGSYYVDPYIYMAGIDKYFGNNDIKSDNPINIGNDLYIVNYGGVQAEGSDKIYSRYEEYECVKISADGKIEKAPIFDSVVSGLLVNRDDDNVSFTDPTTGKTNVFSKYSVEAYNKADNNILLMLRGKDNNVYFTVIDKNCKILFDPVMGKKAQANEGKVILETANGHSVLDYSGNVLIAEGKYQSIETFNSGIAWAIDSSGNYVGIDEKGNIVIS